MRRGYEQLLATPEADSVRAVELVKQHPGKTWVLEDDGRRCNRCSTSRTSTSPGTRASTRRCPQVYVQNSALEIAWTRVVAETGTREGRVVAPFFTEGYEGFNVDDEEDWERAERLVAEGAAVLPAVEAPPYAPAR